MEIRIAELNDLNALVGLLQDLFAQEEEFTPEPARQLAGLRLIMNNPAVGMIFVAVDNHTIVGMTSLLFSVSTALGQRVATLEDMIVTSGFRGKGIGTKLISSALQYCKSHDIARITLLTDRDNYDAHNFYRSMGFEPSNMLVFRTVP